MASPPSASITAGSTAIDTPVPSRVVNPGSLYQYQSAPSPRLPPVTVSVLLVPTQALSLVTEIPVGSVEGILTVTSWLTAAVVLQSPSALT